MLKKDALIARYKYDGDKLDKTWNLLKERINNKGRNIAFRMKLMLKLKIRDDEPDQDKENEPKDLNESF